jgi:hypothetical protein
VGKDSDTSDRRDRREAKCIELAATGTEKPIRSLVLASKKWAWMALSKKE